MTRLLGIVFDNTWGKLAAAAAGFLALVVVFAWDQRNVGRTNAVLEINNKAQAQVKEARRARAGVPDGGNVRWLRDNRCSDC